MAREKNRTAMMPLVVYRLPEHMVAESKVEPDTLGWADPDPEDLDTAFNESYAELMPEGFGIGWSQLVDARGNVAPGIVIRDKEDRALAAALVDPHVMMELGTWLLRNGELISSHRVTLNPELRGAFKAAREDAAKQFLEDELLVLRERALTNSKREFEARFRIERSVDKIELANAVEKAKTETQDEIRREFGDRLRELVAAATTTDQQERDVILTELKPWIREVLT